MLQFHNIAIRRRGKKIVNGSSECAGRECEESGGCVGGVGCAWGGNEGEIEGF